MSTLSLWLRGVVCAMMAAAAASALAQTTSNGPYYAWPSWDQSFACTTTATCPRFVVLSNMGSDAVLDRETGLVWERSPSTSTFTWGQGQVHCTVSTVGNRMGWRLPTIQELASLQDPTVPPFTGSPTIPAGHPFTVQATTYWSATTRASDSSFAWDASFFGGGLGSVDKTDSIHAWCVRGGQGGDSQ